MKKLATILAALFCAFSLMMPATVLAADPPATAGSSAKDAVCEGIGLTTGASGCTAPEGSPTVDSTLKNAVNLLSLMVGFAAIVMILIGGFKFITAGGESAKVASARDTILYAIVGLVVASLAQVIVRFVLTKT